MASDTRLDMRRAGQMCPLPLKKFVPASTVWGKVKQGNWRGIQFGRLGFWIERVKWIAVTSLLPLGEFNA